MNILRFACTYEHDMTSHIADVYKLNLTPTNSLNPSE